jgi:hypothetical protein
MAHCNLVYHRLNLLFCCFHFCCYISGFLWSHRFLGFRADVLLEDA